MKKIILVLLACVSLVPAEDTFHSGTVAVTATEDVVNTISYINIRDALVTSIPASSITYKYRIKTLGSTTKTLKTSAPADVVVGTTVVVPPFPPPVTNETPNLLYTPKDDEFTLFPTTSTPSTPAVVVAVIDVLDPVGNVRATVDLRIDIQGVVDTRADGSGKGYYQTAVITQPAPIIIQRGSSVKMNYVEFAARCGFFDKERDGSAGFSSLDDFSLGGNDGWSLAFDNPPGSPYSDLAFTKGHDFSSFYYHLYYGDSIDYSTDSLTISIPSDHPLGTFDLLKYGFGFSPGGWESWTGWTPDVILRVTVVSGGGGAGGTGGGGGSGSGGCGVGALSSLLMLMLSGFALYRRRPEA